MLRQNKRAIIFPALSCTRQVQSSVVHSTNTSMLTLTHGRAVPLLHSLLPQGSRQATSEHPGSFQKWRGWDPSLLTGIKTLLHSLPPSWRAIIICGKQHNHSANNSTTISKFCRAFLVHPRGILCSVAFSLVGLTEIQWSSDAPYHFRVLKKWKCLSPSISLSRGSPLQGGGGLCVGISELIILMGYW